MDFINFNRSPVFQGLVYILHDSAVNNLSTTRKVHLVTTAVMFGGMNNPQQNANVEPIQKVYVGVKLIKIL